MALVGIGLATACSDGGGGASTTPVASSGVHSSATGIQATAVPSGSSTFNLGPLGHVELGPFVQTNNAAEVSGPAVGAAVTENELLRKRVTVLGGAPEPLLFGDAYVLRLSATYENATFVLPVKNTGTDTLCLTEFAGVQYLDSTGTPISIANSTSVSLNGSAAPGSSQSDYFNDCLAPGEIAYATTILSSPPGGSNGVLYSRVAAVRLYVTLSEFSFTPSSGRIEPAEYTYQGGGQLALRVVNQGSSDVGLESPLTYFVLDADGAPLAAGEAQLRCPGVLAPGDSAWAVAESIGYDGSGAAGLWVVTPFNKVSGLSDPTGNAANCTIGASPVSITKESAVPIGLTVVGNDVYFTMPAAGEVRRVPSNGGPSVVVAEGQKPNGPILANATHVYWTNEDQGTVAYVPISGGPVQTLFPPQGEPYALALNQAEVYWSSLGGETAGIFLLPLSGGSPYRSVDVFSAPDIAADDSNLYWIDRSSTPNVYRQPFASGVREFLGSGDPIDLALFNGDLYWADGDGTIFRAAAGSVTSESVARSNEVKALAVDASGVYWFDGADLVHLAPGSSLSQPLAAGQDGATIALDATHVYWTSPGDSSVKAVAKPE